MAAGRVRLHRGITICFVILILGCRCLTAWAEPKVVESQTREFSVNVDGEERGSLTMDISTRDDHSDVVQIETDLTLKLAILQFRYTCSGTEVWKGDRLIGMENLANYNGKKYTIKALANRKGLQVTVNGKASEVQPDVWATSYWRIPERIVELANPNVVLASAEITDSPASVPVPLFNSDKGKVLNGQLKRVGDETLTFGGKKVACTHYEISGDVQVHLWYDGRRRLLRQESIDQGHKTVLKLTRLATMNDGSGKAQATKPPSN